MSGGERDDMQVKFNKDPYVIFEVDNDDWFDIFGDSV